MQAEVIDEDDDLVPDGYWDALAKLLQVLPRAPPEPPEEGDEQERT